MVKLRLLIYATLFSVSYLTFPPTGSIRGTIKDAKSNEELVGAIIKIEELKSSTITDMNGYFSISKIPAGHYIIKISYPAYEEKILGDVEVNNGFVTELNTLLIPKEKTSNETKLASKVSAENLIK